MVPIAHPVDVGPPEGVVVGRSIRILWCHAQADNDLSVRVRTVCSRIPNEIFECSQIGHAVSARPAEGMAQRGSERIRQ